MVRADVALTGLDGDAKAVVGSFTVDGLTYAIDGEGQAALVAVAPLGGGEGKAEADASSAAFGEGAEDSGAEGARAEADGATLTLPAAVSYGGTDYSLMRIAPLALDGCGAAALSIPASVETVDTAAALGCDTLAEVTVAEDNPAFSVLDGYLADKAQTSILLVPEGRVGQLRIPQSVQAVDPRVFSHCTRVTDLVVDAGCPGLTSWNGSICTSDLATLVRVPAGARTVTLPSECSAIGASAFSGCTELESIEVQGNVESIAPSAFGEIEEATPLVAQSDTARITGLVAVANSALSSIQIDKASITVTLPDGADPSVWESAGFTHATSNEGAEAPAADFGETEEGTALNMQDSATFAAVNKTPLPYIDTNVWDDAAGGYARGSNDVSKAWWEITGTTLKIGSAPGVKVQDLGFARTTASHWRPYLNTSGTVTAVDTTELSGAESMNYWFSAPANVSSIEARTTSISNITRLVIPSDYDADPRKSMVPENVQCLLIQSRITAIPATASIPFGVKGAFQAYAMNYSLSRVEDGFTVAESVTDPGGLLYDSYSLSYIGEGFGGNWSKTEAVNMYRIVAYTGLVTLPKSFSFPAKVAGNPDNAFTGYQRNVGLVSLNMTYKGDTVSNLMPADSSTDVWAYWQSNFRRTLYPTQAQCWKVTFKYEADGSFAATAWVRKGGLCSIPNQINNEKRSCYTLDANGEQVPFVFDETPVVAETTVYIRAESRITYINEDGSAINAEGSDTTVAPEFFLQPTFHSGEKVIIDAVPVREGYEFLGWTIEGITGDTPQKQAVIPAGTTGDKVAVAHWAELPKRNYLITTADAAAGYTVDDFPVETGVSSPKAWWTLDDNGELYIGCELGATISQKNFENWKAVKPPSIEGNNVGAWGMEDIRRQVTAIRMDEKLQLEPTHLSTDQIMSDDWASAGLGMNYWFQGMPSLADISEVRILPGVQIVFCLFYGDYSLKSIPNDLALPDSLLSIRSMFPFTGIESIPASFNIPSQIVDMRYAFEGNVRLKEIGDGFALPFTVQTYQGMLRNCDSLISLPASLNLSRSTAKGDPARNAFQQGYDARIDPSWQRPAFPLRTFYAGSIPDLYPGATGKTAAETKQYWLAEWSRELVGPGDLASPQAAVRFQVPKADGSGYVSYDVLADSSGRVTAPAVTRYGYSKVTWRYDTGASGAELGHVAVSGPCGSEGLAFEASVLPDIEAGLKGPVYAEVSGLMLSMDMPVGSGNLWYAIDCGEVMALGPSASTRAGMEDAHELSFESYTPVPTKLSATFTANDAADGTPAAEKLFPNGLDEGTGFALSLDGGASETAGLKALIGAGGSQGFSSLASLDASPSAREPGRASGTLALKLGGANDVDFAEEATEYSVADIVWTLDASAQYDFWATDDVATYSAYEIKQAAEAISAYGATADVPAFRQYDRYLKQQSPDADPVFSIKVYDQPDGAASTHKVDVLGIAQDTKASGGKAGLSFGWHGIYAVNKATADGQLFDNALHPSRNNAGGWAAMQLRTRIQSPSGFLGSLGELVQEGIVAVRKRQQNPGVISGVTSETLFLPTAFEVFGVGNSTVRNPNETTANQFQYQYFARGGKSSSRNDYAVKEFNGVAGTYWTRSVTNGSPDHFVVVSTHTVNWGNTTNTGCGFVPLFCF